jgi:hypothetical protein
MRCLPRCRHLTLVFEFNPDGEVVVGPLFRQLEAAWMEGIIAMSRAGANIILDDVSSAEGPRSAVGKMPSAT